MHIRVHEKLAFTICYKLVFQYMIITVMQLKYLHYSLQKYLTDTQCSYIIFVVKQFFLNFYLKTLGLCKNI